MLSTNPTVVFFGQFLVSCTYIFADTESNTIAYVDCFISFWYWCSSKVVATIGSTRVLCLINDCFNLIKRSILRSTYFLNSLLCDQFVNHFNKSCSASSTKKCNTFSESLQTISSLLSDFHLFLLLWCWANFVEKSFSLDIICSICITKSSLNKGIGLSCETYTRYLVLAWYRMPMSKRILQYKSPMGNCNSFSF